MDRFRELGSTVEGFNSKVGTAFTTTHQQQIDLDKKYQKLKNEVSSSKEQIKKLVEVVQALTKIVEDMPKGGGDNDKKEEKRKRVGRFDV